MFEAESPKAHAVRLLAELDYTSGERSNKVALIAQAFREWEARGLETFAKALDGLTNAVTQAVRSDLLVRAKELRGKSIDIS